MHNIVSIMLLSGETATPTSVERLHRGYHGMVIILLHDVVQQRVVGRPVEEQASISHLQTCDAPQERVIIETLCETDGDASGYGTRGGCLGGWICVDFKRVGVGLDGENEYAVAL